MPFDKIPPRWLDVYRTHPLFDFTDLFMDITYLQLKAKDGQVYGGRSR